MSRKKKEKKKQKARGGCGKGAKPEAAAKTGGKTAGEAGEPCPGGKKCGQPKKHLCRIAKSGDVDALRELVRGAAFLCAKCGRAAASARSLCRPVAL